MGMDKLSEKLGEIQEWYNAETGIFREIFIADTLGLSSVSLSFITWNWWQL